MKTYTWLWFQVLKQQLLRGNLFALFYGKTRGYSLYDEYMEVRLKGKEKPFVIKYKDIPYTREEMSSFFRTDYISDHWLTQREIKRTVYILTARSNHGELTVETTNKRIVDVFKTQYDAMQYNNVDEFVYRDYVLDCSGDYRGVGYSDEKRVFDNVIQYKDYETITYIEYP